VGYELWVLSSRLHVMGYKMSTIKEVVFWIIAGLISAIAFIPYIPIDGFGFSADDVLFLAVLLIGSLFLFFNWKNKTYKKLPKGFVWSFLCLAVVGLFSALYNAKNAKDFVAMIGKGSGRFILILLFLTIMFNLLDSRKKIKDMLIMLISFSVIESIFGIFSYIFSWQGPFNIGIATQRDYSVLSGLVNGRINGTFGSVIENFIGSNLLGAYLVMLIPIAVAFIIISKKFWQKVVFSLILSLQLICLSLTYTRTSIMYAVIILLVFAWMLGKKKLILTVIFFSILFAIFTPGLKERFLIDSTNRVAIWESAVLVAKENPLWGVGPGKYLEKLSGNMIDYNVFAFETENLTPHNFFLWTWATLGIFGVVAIFWIIWEITKSFWNIFYGISDPDAKVLMTGIIASSLGFFLQNLTNNFLFVPVVAVYFWTLMVIAIRMDTK